VLVTNLNEVDFSLFSSPDSWTRRLGIVSNLFFVYLIKNSMGVGTLSHLALLGPSIPTVRL
jgi:hypothetical protein